MATYKNNADFDFTIINIHRQSLPTSSIYILFLSKRMISKWEHYFFPTKSISNILLLLYNKKDCEIEHFLKYSIFNFWFPEKLSLYIFESWK